MPKLQKHEVERALRDTAEHERIQKLLPTRKRLAEELGPFKTCATPTYVEEPGGKSQVNITDEKATPEENRRRWSTYVESTSESRALEIARSHRRSAETGEVVFHDVRNGEARATTPEREEHIARKRWARPGRSRRVFVGFGRARN